MSFVIWRDASSPSIPGMQKSSTIRSGRNSSAFSIASTPLTASPHTSKPLLENSERKTVRTAGWWSAISMRCKKSYRRARIDSSLGASYWPCGLPWQVVLYDYATVEKVVTDPKT